MFNRNETAWDRHQGLYMAADMAGGAPAPEWTPEMRAAMEKVLPKDVASFVKSLIPMVGSQAWIFMGKAVNPMEGKITLDLDQARLAVEVVEVLLEKVDRFLVDEERTLLKQLDTDLKLNFVQSLKEQAEARKREKA